MRRRRGLQALDRMRVRQLGLRGRTLLRADESCFDDRRLESVNSEDATDGIARVYILKPEQIRSAPTLISRRVSR